MITKGISTEQLDGLPAAPSLESPGACSISCLLYLAKLGQKGFDSLCSSAPFAEKFDEAQQMQDHTEIYASGASDLCEGSLHIFGVSAAEQQRIFGSPRQAAVEDFASVWSKVMNLDRFDLGPMVLFAAVVPCSRLSRQLRAA